MESDHLRLRRTDGSLSANVKKDRKATTLPWSRIGWRKSSDFDRDESPIDQSRCLLTHVFAFFQVSPAGITANVEPQCAAIFAGTSRYQDRINTAWRYNRVHGYAS